MGTGKISGTAWIVQPTYTTYVTRKIKSSAVSNGWANNITSLQNKDGSLNIGEIYDYQNILVLDKTFIMVYERNDIGEAFNIGATVFKEEVNMTIDIRSGLKNDFWVAYSHVRKFLRSIIGQSELINARGTEKKYLIEYRGSQDFSDKMKKLWRRVIEIRLYTTEGV